ncbi:MAG: WXG100 family type VII secretion target [Anaerolineae bacterium]|nr:WXG100 family type VII secretion target [Anaerolineae bacterium]
MSQVIHIRPEELRSTANRLDTEQDEMGQQLNQMIATVESLDWTGMAQQDYLDNFRETVRGLQQNLEEVLEMMIDHLKRIADQFEQLDQDVA